MNSTSFRQLGISEPVCAALAANAIERPFPIQLQVLPHALAGSDLLAKSPTGSGKTLAFGLALVEAADPDVPGVQALVLVPTRELALQVAEQLVAPAAARRLKVAACYGGTQVYEQAKVSAAAAILVATPGRLNDLLERRLISLKATRMLVLDEADRMLDMGFRPQVDQIVRQMPQARQTMFFSATLDGPVGELAEAYTYDAITLTADLPVSADALEVEHQFVPVTEGNKLETLIEMLQAEDGLTLVFTRTKRGADKLVEKLLRQSHKAGALHGDLNQSQRERALGRFGRGELRVLVATDVASRGLDLPEISRVVNFDPPAEGRDYTHRCGRTGRAGRGGVAVSLVLPDQQTETSRVANANGQAGTFRETGMKTAPAKLLYQGSRGGKWGAPRRARRMI